jgi:hypothetical protein
VLPGVGVETTDLPQDESGENWGIVVKADRTGGASLVN